MYIPINWDEILAQVCSLNFHIKNNPPKSNSRIKAVLIFLTKIKVNPVNASNRKIVPIEAQRGNRDTIR